MIKAGYGVSLLAAVLLLGGCGDQSIFNSVDLNSGRSVTTGARQRIVTNMKVGSGTTHGRVVPERIVCAEPSPDVALAVANSFGGGVEVATKGSASLSGSQVEGIAQLAERLATIQLLRDGLYRACESYANGAISSAEYSMIVSGVDDSMVTLLLGEMAAGAFGRSLASSGGSGSAAASAVARTLTGDMDDALKKAKAAEEAQGIAVTKKVEADKARKAADAETKESEKTQLTQTANEKATAASAAEADAQSKRKEFEDAVAKLKGSTAAWTTASQTVTGAGGITAQASAELAAEIRKIQEVFFERRHGAALVAACVSKLSQEAQGGPRSVLGQNCPQILTAALNGTNYGTGSWHDFRLKKLEKETALVMAKAAQKTVLSRKDCDFILMKLKNETDEPAVALRSKCE